MNTGSDDDRDAELLECAQTLLQRPSAAIDEASLSHLRDAIAARIAASSASAKVLGPVLGRLNALQHKPTPKAESPQWVTVGEGRLAIGHRPKLRSLQQLREEGCTHVLTLLSEREGAQTIGAEAKRVGLEWVWFPLANADLPAQALDFEARRVLRALNRALDAGAGLYIHCSAGIHRTGMVAFALLRARGVSRDEAQVLLKQLRAHTAEGVGSDRLQWAERLLPT